MASTPIQLAFQRSVSQSCSRWAAPLQDHGAGHRVGHGVRRGSWEQGAGGADSGAVAGVITLGEAIWPAWRR